MLTSHKKTTILILNDSSVLTAVIRATVETQPDLQVVATAVNGLEAIEQVSRHLPDLVLMDIHMPKMNGIQATRQIIRERPKTRILITSATITRNMRHIFEALQYGAVDYARSPSLSFKPGTAVSEQQLIEGGKTVLHKIRATLMVSAQKLARHNRGELEQSPRGAATTTSTEKRTARLTLLAIGCSTGGPTAAAALIKRLQHPFSAPILVCLHIDAEFTQGFASWLGDQTGFPCSIARNGERPQPGHIYVAPGGTNNLEVTRAGNLAITPPHPDQYFLPNINHLFSSIAKNIGPQACGIVLTGMGSDGAAGLKDMLESGGIGYAQDSDSAAIDAMPKAARAVLKIDQGYPPAQLATQLNGLFVK